MPALGIAQETGKLLQWLKAEGQPVTKGEVLMVVETDKATVEIDAPASGTLSHVTASVGDEVPVGQVIALILAAGEKTQESMGERETGSKGEKAPIAPTAPPLPGSPSPKTSGPAAPIAASPLARRIAEENHVDLSQVKPAGERIEKADVLAYIEAMQSEKATSGRIPLASPKARKAAADAGLNVATIRGSGPNGAVLYADVAEAAASAKQPEPAAQPIEAQKPSHIWRIMAERTTQSWTSVPHFYLTREVNANRLMTWRERAQKRATAKITYTDLLVRLVAAALREHPRINASWKEGTILNNPEINVGLAVAVEDGLVVPVIHHADELSIVELAQQRTELVTRAQSGRLKPDDISGGTFTISNLGMYGVDEFHAIVNPPQAAILAVGRIVDRVVPVEDHPAVQPMMTMTLSCDHRAVDGARGAQFLQTLAEMIEEPLGLLD
jgi:pyruvate dehydrogenase E2 component (dihydrolipoamide acetyltransferase)